jgi:hypothetical protein
MVSLFNERGVLMTHVNTVALGVTQPELPTGESTIRVRINRTNFLPGHYTASFWVMNPQGHIYTMSENGITFEIAQVPIYGTYYVDASWGAVYSDIEFSAISDAIRPENFAQLLGRQGWAEIPIPLADD